MRMAAALQPPAYSRLCDSDGVLARAYYEAYGVYASAVVTDSQRFGSFSGSGTGGRAAGWRNRARRDLDWSAIGDMRVGSVDASRAGGSRRGKRGGRKFRKGLSVRDDVSSESSDSVTSSSESSESEASVASSPSSVRCDGGDGLDLVRELPVVDGFESLGEAHRVLACVHLPMVRFLDAVVACDVEKAEYAVADVSGIMQLVSVECDVGALGEAFLTMVEAYADVNGVDLAWLFEVAGFSDGCLGARAGPEVSSGSACGEVLSLRGGGADEVEGDEVFADVAYAADLGVWYCGMCTCEASSRAAAVVHLRGHGVRYPPEVWGEGSWGECNVCGEAVARDRWKRHLKSHDITRTCEYCGEVFSRVCDLNKHRKKHERPIRCGDCGSGFVYQQELERHRQVYHGVTRVEYVCGCGMRFLRKDHMTRHQGRGRRRASCASYSSSVS